MDMWGPTPKTCGPQAGTEKALLMKWLQEIEGRDNVEIFYLNGHPVALKVFSVTTK